MGVQEYAHVHPWTSKVKTGHEPLIPILNNKMLIDMSPRIQRMRMTLLKYSFITEQVKGFDMEHADALSRAPTQKHASHKHQTRSDASYAKTTTP